MKVVCQVRWQQHRMPWQLAWRYRAYHGYDFATNPDLRRISFPSRSIHANITRSTVRSPISFAFWHFFTSSKSSSNAQINLFRSFNNSEVVRSQRGEEMWGRRDVCVQKKWWSKISSVSHLYYSKKHGAQTTGWNETTTTATVHWINHHTRHYRHNRHYSSHYTNIQTYSFSLAPSFTLLFIQLRFD